MCGSSGTCTIPRGSFDGVDCGQVIVSTLPMILFSDIVQVYQILTSTQMRPTQEHEIQIEGPTVVEVFAGWERLQGFVLILSSKSSPMLRKQSKLHKLCDLFFTPP